MLEYGNLYVGHQHPPLSDIDILNGLLHFFGPVLPSFFPGKLWLWTLLHEGRGWVNYFSYRCWTLLLFSVQASCSPILYLTFLSPKLLMIFTVRSIFPPVVDLSSFWLYLTSQPLCWDSVGVHRPHTAGFFALAFWHLWPDYSLFWGLLVNCKVLNSIPGPSSFKASSPPALSPTLVKTKVSPHIANCA